jgi:hypothetical protein
MFSQLSAESAPIADFKHSGITLVHSSHFKFCSRVASRGPPGSRHRAAGGLPPGTAGAKFAACDEAPAALRQ